MFYVFALVMALSGQVQPLIDQDHPYQTFAECTASIPDRLSAYEKEMTEQKREAVIAFGCVSIAPKGTGI